MGFRPVVCHICHRPLHYVGDPDFEAEIDLEFTPPYDPNSVNAIYMHERCYRTLRVVRHAGGSASNSTRESTSKVDISVFSAADSIFKEFDRLMDCVFGRHR